MPHNADDAQLLQLPGNDQHVDFVHELSRFRDLWFDRENKQWKFLADNATDEVMCSFYQQVPPYEMCLHQDMHYCRKRSDHIPAYLDGISSTSESGSQALRHAFQDFVGAANARRNSAFQFCEALGRISALVAFAYPFFNESAASSWWHCPDVLATISEFDIAVQNYESAVSCFASCEQAIKNLITRSWGITDHNPDLRSRQALSMFSSTGGLPDQRIFPHERPALCQRSSLKRKAEDVDEMDQMEGFVDGRPCKK